MSHNSWKWTGMDEMDGMSREMGRWGRELLLDGPRLRAWGAVDAGMVTEISEGGLRRG